MKKRILVIFCIICILSLSVYAKKNDPAPVPPRNVRVISQNLDGIILVVTVVDLDTNELVIMHYNAIQKWATYEFRLVQVIRTGTYVKS